MFSPWISTRPSRLCGGDNEFHAPRDIYYIDGTLNFSDLGKPRE